MLVAALDTATLVLSCALVDVSAGAPPRVLGERVERAEAGGRRKAGEGAGGSAPRPGGHGAALPGALVALLAAQGRSLADVEGYAIGLGPGSFTGLRIGLATWKGLAYANRRPVAGASSLAAMALAAAPDAADGALLVPLLDAKKGEVYAGFYRARGGALVEAGDEIAVSPAELAARVRSLAATGGRPVAFGEGYDAHAAALAPAVPRLATAIATPTAAAVAALAAERLRSATFDAQALFALEPHYVRASEAELKFPDGLGPGAVKGG